METEVLTAVKQRNDAFTTIYNRRAVKKYKNKPVTKKFILLIMLIAFSIKTFTQDYYYKKSKNQKTTAWILLAAGTTMTAIGIIGGGNTLDNSNYPFINDDDASKLGAYGGILIAGIACDIASIPFFISASKNKRLAGEVRIDNQKILLPQNGFVATKYIPGLKFKITF